MIMPGYRRPTDIRGFGRVINYEEKACIIFITFKLRITGRKKLKKRARRGEAAEPEQARVRACAGVFAYQGTGSLDWNKVKRNYALPPI
jgi:hypothetical protein